MYCDELILLISTYCYMWWLVRTVSTRRSEIGSCCNEQTLVENYALASWDRGHSLQQVGSDCWLFDIKVCHCSALGCHYSKPEIHCCETFTHRSEWSIPCDNVMYDVSDELSCWYINMCLVRIDSYDDVMYVLHVGTPAQAYTWDIANESLNCDDWLQR